MAVRASSKAGAMAAGFRIKDVCITLGLIYFSAMSVVIFLLFFNTREGEHKPCFFVIVREWRYYNRLGVLVAIYKWFITFPFLFKKHFSNAIIVASDKHILHLLSISAFKCRLLVCK